MINLKPEDISQLFSLFDDDNSGTLDFREFLTCISFLIRGTMKDKIELAFYINDKDKKDYLT